MKSLFLLTILVVATTALPSDLPKLLNEVYISGRITNGEITPISKVPYQVSIEIKGSFHCGGSIIANEWILTAAHCATAPVKSYQIRVGSNTCEYGGHVYKVAEKYLHEEYFVSAKGVPRNDIALFHLKKPIELNEKQKPVTLFDKDEEVEIGTYGIVTGYGLTETGRLSVTLRSATVPTISKQDCFDAYVPKFGGIPNNQICAAYPDGGKDACTGDSGGPFTIGGRLAGIVSWGDGCGIRGNPGVYTEVSKYRDWIVTTTGLDL